MFGQGDVPTQALENAEELQSILDGSGEDEATISSANLLQRVALGNAEELLDRSAAELKTSPPKLVSGRVVSVTKGWDRRVLLDVDGRRGYLGSRHSRKRGFSFKKGEVLENLRVEADTGVWLILSVQTANVPETHEGQSED
mmetsp:Transcript_17392/g.32167  ORF Transcript_17392/g.32167 Transcript_17392/m.32167 type:complete len:142 (-) Transcript_17392:28-453(-)